MLIHIHSHDKCLGWYGVITCEWGWKGGRKSKSEGQGEGEFESKNKGEDQYKDQYEDLADRWGVYVPTGMYMASIMTASGSSMQSILFHNSTIGVALRRKEWRIEWSGVEWREWNGVEMIEWKGKKREGVEW